MPPLGSENRDLIGDLNPDLVPNPPPQPDPQPGSGADDRIVLTREQFDELIRSNAEEAERNRQIMSQLLHPQPVVAAAPQLPDVSLNIDGLPDPAYDRDGFLKGLSGRLSDTVKQVQERVTAAATSTVQQAQTTQARLDEAWAMIQREYPETAEFPDLVDAMARRWADGQRSRGVDPMQLLARDTAAVAHEVGAYVADQLHLIRGEGDQGGQPAQPQPATRTAGIPGGRPRGGAPRQNDAPPRTLVDDLKDFQSRARIY